MTSRRHKVRHEVVPCVPIQQIPPKNSSYPSKIVRQFSCCLCLTKASGRVVLGPRYRPTEPLQRILSTVAVHISTAEFGGIQHLSFIGLDTTGQTSRRELSHPDSFRLYTRYCPLQLCRAPAQTAARSSIALLDHARGSPTRRGGPPCRSMRGCV